MHVRPEHRERAFEKVIHIERVGVVAPLDVFDELPQYRQSVRFDSRRLDPDALTLRAASHATQLMPILARTRRLVFVKGLPRDVERGVAPLTQWCAAGRAEHWPRAVIN